MISIKSYSKITKKYRVSQENGKDALNVVEVVAPSLSDLMNEFIKFSLSVFYSNLKPVDTIFLVTKYFPFVTLL